MNIDDDIELIVTPDGFVWMYIPETEEFLKTEFIVKDDE